MGIYNQFEVYVITPDLVVSDQYDISDIMRRDIKIHPDGRTFRIGNAYQRGWSFRLQEQFINWYIRGIGLRPNRPMFRLFARDVRANFIPSYDPLAPFFFKKVISHEEAVSIASEFDCIIAAHGVGNGVLLDLRDLFNLAAKTPGAFLYIDDFYVGEFHENIDSRWLIV